jgi:transposase
MTDQLFHANLFSDLSNVTLRRVFKTDQGRIMEAHGQNSAACPGCQSISRSRHSRYWRSLKDLPVQGTQVILRLHLGRWRCRNAGCQRRIFTERLPKVCAPYAQQTKRTDEIIAAVGHALGGRPRPTLDVQARHTGRRRYADPASQKSGLLACVAPSPSPWCR